MSIVKISLSKFSAAFTPALRLSDSNMASKVYLSFTARNNLSVFEILTILKYEPPEKLAPYEAINY